MVHRREVEEGRRALVSSVPEALLHSIGRAWIDKASRQAERAAIELFV